MIMRAIPDSFLKFLLLLIILTSLVGCNYPAGTPTGAPQPATPSVLGPLVTIIPHVPDGATPNRPTQPLPPSVVLPSYTPAPSSTATPAPLDRKDINSVIRWVRAALDGKDARVFDVGVDVFQEFFLLGISIAQKPEKGNEREEDYFFHLIIRFFNHEEPEG